MQLVIVYLVAYQGTCHQLQPRLGVSIALSDLPKQTIVSHTISAMLTRHPLHPGWQAHSLCVDLS